MDVDNISSPTHLDPNIPLTDWLSGEGSPTIVLRGIYSASNPQHTRDDVGRDDHSEGLQADNATPHLSAELEDVPELARLINNHPFRQSSRSAYDNDLTGYIRRDGDHPIASGSYGDIYRGFLRTNEREIKVAIKAIKLFVEDFTADMPKKTKRLRREIKVWQRSHHPNIIPLFGVVTGFGEFPALVCPWADNGALTSYLERFSDSLQNSQRLSLLDDIAKGLHYLHSLSIVHGDLSGSNVLIHGDGRACIADFGLSTLLTELSRSTFATSFRGKGTLRWTAPELLDLGDIDGENGSDSIRTEITPSTCSDVYSFGCIMLQILTGNVPYHYYNRDAQVITAIMKRITPRRPPQSATNLVADLEWQFIQRCWLSATFRPRSTEIVDFIDNLRAGQ